MNINQGAWSNKIEQGAWQVESLILADGLDIQSSFLALRSAIIDSSSINLISAPLTAHNVGDFVLPVNIIASELTPSILTGVVAIPLGYALDDYCNDITKWENADNGGESTQVTFDDKSCFYFNCPPTFPYAYATLNRTVLAGVSDYNAVLSFYVNEVDRGDFNIRISGTTDYRLYVQFYSSGANEVSGIYIYDDIDGGTTIPLILNEKTWYKAEFKVHTNQTLVDIYIDDVLIQANVNCKDGIGDENKVVLQGAALSSQTVKVYVDYIQIYNAPGPLSLKSDLESSVAKGITTNYPSVLSLLIDLKDSSVVFGIHIEPSALELILNSHEPFILALPEGYVDIGLRVRQSGATYVIIAKALEASHKLRIEKAGTTYGIPLLATNDDYASPIRIYDGSDVKALPKSS